MLLLLLLVALIDTRVTQNNPPFLLKAKKGSTKAAGHLDRRLKIDPCQQKEVLINRI